MALTQDDIWQVANELDAEGMRPTLNAVRKKLGTGSFSTISEAMAEWRKNKVSSTTSINQDPLPPAIVEALHSHAASVWQAATSLAEKRLDADRVQLATERQTAQETIKEATELADALAQENETLQAKLANYEELHRERDQLKYQLDDQKKHSAAEIIRITEQMQRSDGEAAEARREAKEALGDAAALRGQLEAYKEQLAALSPVKKQKAAQGGPEK